jgi:hypothetical protein
MGDLPAGALMVERHCRGLVGTLADGIAASNAVIPGCAHLAQARNPYSRSWLWIPGSRGACHRAALRADPLARPGMTVSNQLTPRKSRFPISTPLWRRMPCVVAAWK